MSESPGFPAGACAPRDDALVAYDPELAERVRECLASRTGVLTEKAMFGGLSFMVDGRMVVAVSGKGGILLPVGAENHYALAALEHVGPMVMGKQVSDTWVHVQAEGVRTMAQLRTWIGRSTVV